MLCIAATAVKSSSLPWPVSKTVVPSRSRNSRLESRSIPRGRAESRQQDRSRRRSRVHAVKSSGASGMSERETDSSSTAGRSRTALPWNVPEMRRYLRDVIVTKNGGMSVRLSSAIDRLTSVEGSARPRGPMALSLSGVPAMLRWRRLDVHDGSKSMSAPSTDSAPQSQRKAVRWSDERVLVSSAVSSSVSEAPRTQRQRRELLCSVAILCSSSMGNRCSMLMPMIVELPSLSPFSLSISLCPSRRLS
mmetsp:Transcript_11425/g.46274  ORF Transcript_11425/g.46274 Transcript_11425/m.46274 type:complete len:248 (+) Transcript_11425:625-1368(+)